MKFPERAAQIQDAIAAAELAKRQAEAALQQEEDDLEVAEEDEPEVMDMYEGDNEEEFITDDNGMVYAVL